MKTFKKYALRRLKESILKETAAPEGFNKIKATSEFVPFEDKTPPFNKNIMNASAKFEANVFWSGNDKNNHTGKTTVWLRKYGDYRAEQQEGAGISQVLVWDEMRARDLASLVRDLEKQRNFNAAASYLNSKNPTSVTNNEKSAKPKRKGFFSSLLGKK